jgi:hypothetical protein
LATYNWPAQLVRPLVVRYYELWQLTNEALDIYGIYTYKIHAVSYSGFGDHLDMRWEARLRSPATTFMSRSRDLKRGQLRAEKFFSPR